MTKTLKLDLIAFEEAFKRMPEDYNFSNLQRLRENILMQNLESLKPFENPEFNITKLEPQEQKKILKNLIEDLKIRDKIESSKYDIQTQNNKLSQNNRVKLDPKILDEFCKNIDKPDQIMLQANQIVENLTPQQLESYSEKSKAAILDDDKNSIYQKIIAEQLEHYSKAFQNDIVTECYVATSALKMSIAQIQNPENFAKYKEDFALSKKHLQQARLKLFFEADFPRSSIKLKIGDEKITIEYDKQQKKTIAKDSAGREITYTAIPENNNINNSYTNFKACLKLATANKISDKQVDYIVSNFTQASISQQGFNTFDNRKQELPIRGAHDGTLNLELYTKGHMGIKFNTMNQSIVPPQTTLDYTQYQGMVDKSGKLIASHITTQNSKDYSLITTLPEEFKHCISKNLEPSIRETIAQNLINNIKKLSKEFFHKDLNGKTVVEVILNQPNGKTIIENTLIENITTYLTRSFANKKGKTLSKQDAENIKEGLKSTIEPFCQTKEFAELDKSLDLDAIVRRTSREHDGLKQGFSSTVGKYLRRLLDQINGNKSPQKTISTSSIVQNFREKTQPPQADLTPNNVPKGLEKRRLVKSKSK
jgi:hypothetical protein